MLSHLANEYIDEIKTLHSSNNKNVNDLAIALLSLTDSKNSEYFKLESNDPEINCLIDIKKKVFINYKTDNLVKFLKEINELK